MPYPPIERTLLPTFSGARYVGADDILNRAQEALVLLQLSEISNLGLHTMFSHVIKSDDFFRYRELSNAVFNTNSLPGLLWESSLIRVTSCWVFERDKNEHSLAGEKPAFVIEDVQDDEMRGTIKTLRKLRNERVAHPVVQSQGGQAVAVGRTGGPRRAMNGWVTTRTFDFLTDELYRQLKRKIDFTISEAKRIKSGEFQKHFRK